MFVDEQQELALVDDTFAVQVQLRDGGPSSWGQANHQGVIVAPGKMLLPDVLARMKERDEFSGERIKGTGFIVFEIVTALASPRKIAGTAFATRCDRDDVLIRETIRAIIFLANAIFAAPLRPLLDQSPQLGWQSASSHAAQV